MSIIKLLLKPFRQIILGRQAYHIMFESNGLMGRQHIAALSSHQTTIRQKVESLEYTRFSEVLAKIALQQKKINSVIFIDRDYFGDNTKYAFLYTSPLLEKKNIKTLLITHDTSAFNELQQHGVNNIYLWSPDNTELIKDLLEAKFFIYSHHFSQPLDESQILYSCLAGAKQIQLWHGIPLKKIGIQTRNVAEIWSAQRHLSCFNIDKFIGPSASDESVWREFFNFSEFAPTGYPRNDILFKEPSSLDLISVDMDSYNRTKMAKESNLTVALYSPTFRDDLTSQWTESLDFEGLDSFLKENQMLLLVNFHPFDITSLSKFNRATFENIIILPQKKDIYPTLKQVDFLITDYSSIAFDFALLKKPVFIYRPDHDRYISTSRALFRDFPLNEVNFVISISESFNRFSENTYCLMQPTPYFDQADGKSSERLAAKIEEWINLG